MANNVAAKRHGWRRISRGENANAGISGYQNAYRLAMAAWAMWLAGGVGLARYQ